MGEYAPLSSYSLVSMEHEPACLRDSLDFSRFFLSVMVIELQSHITVVCFPFSGF